MSPKREDIERFGAIDPKALYRIREVFWRQEPLVETAEIDSLAQPSTLSVPLDAGFESPGRFDIRWSKREFYSFHYQEPGDGPAFRFDRHPNPHSLEKHFHPPSRCRDGRGRTVLHRGGAAGSSRSRRARSVAARSRSRRSVIGEQYREPTVVR